MTVFTNNIVVEQLSSSTVIEQVLSCSQSPSVVDGSGSVVIGEFNNKLMTQ